MQSLMNSTLSRVIFRKAIESAMYDFKQKQQNLVFVA